MASEREIRAAAEVLAKLLDVPPGTASEVAKAALEAAERVRKSESEPETGDIIG